MRQFSSVIVYLLGIELYRLVYDKVDDVLDCVGKI